MSTIHTRPFDDISYNSVLNSLKCHCRTIKGFEKIIKVKESPNQIILFWKKSNNNTIEIPVIIHLRKRSYFFSFRNGNIHNVFGIKALFRSIKLHCGI